MPHADTENAVFQLRNEVLSALFAREMSGSIQETQATTDDSDQIHEIRDKSDLPDRAFSRFFVANRLGLAPWTAHIKNPHGDTENAVFQLGNEVLSARFARKLTRESRK